MRTHSDFRHYRLTSTQIDLITYCINQHLREFSPDEDNEARKLMEELNKGGMPTTSTLPEQALPGDPYANYCDI